MSKVTKYNYKRRERARELVDPSKKEVKNTPVFLSPFQYSELLRSAMSDDEISTRKNDKISRGKLFRQRTQI